MSEAEEPATRPDPSPVIVVYLDQALTVRWVKHNGIVVLEERITYLDPARTLEGKRVET